MNTLPTKYHKMSAHTWDIIVIGGARTLNYKILHMYIRYGNIYIYIIYIKLCYISKVGLGTAGFGQFFGQILIIFKVFFCLLCEKLSGFALKIKNLCDYVFQNKSAIISLK